MTQYALDSWIEIRGTFRYSGVLENPDEVALIVRNPSRTVVQYTAADLAHPSIGYYYKRIQLTSRGAWTYVWIGSSIEKSWRSSENEIAVLGDETLR